MKVALIHQAQFPVSGYGGTERVVWWLAKGLHERGIEVLLACRPGSRCPYAETMSLDFSRPVEKQIPGVDLFHHFVTPAYEPEVPYVVTIGGNGKPGEKYLPNTVFVSRNHAERHGAVCFVHNGIDPDEYVYRSEKKRSMIFLAKASWRVKNVRGAIRLARRAGVPLEIVGGERWLLRDFRGVRWRGMLGGAPKAELIADTQALLFPVLWDEPFGIAVIEAMVSGTPVFATPWGSLPELVNPEVGALCRSEEEFLSAIAQPHRFRPEVCRAWALEHFTYIKMAARYHALYERVLDGETLNQPAPFSTKDLGAPYSLPSRIG